MKKFNSFLRKVNEQEDLDIELNPKEIEVTDNTDEIEEPGEAIIKPLNADVKTENAGGSNDELFKKLVEFQIQIRVFHWGTEKYPEHMASDKTYGSVDDILDILVETYQGYSGRVKFGGQYNIIEYSEMDAFAWLTGIEGIIKSLRDGITFSDVQNILDELLGAVSKFKYLLTLK